jgi:formylglycine-generating enzyme required for sulfatase activity
MDKHKYNIYNNFFNILNKKWFIKSKLSIEQFKNELIETFTLTHIISEKININIINLDESNTLYGNINPFIWEYGNILYFWENYILKNTETIAKPQIYDTNAVKQPNRYTLCTEYKNSLLNFTKIQLQLNKLYDFIINQIDCFSKANTITYLSNKGELINVYETNLSESTDINYVILHLIRIGQLYQDSINENFIYTSNFHKIRLFSFEEDIKEDIIEKNQMIEVKPSSYIQGACTINDNTFPPFTISINRFSVGKYPVTNYMYLQFVKDGGYNSIKYWSIDGWCWLNKLKLQHPINWEYDVVNKTWYEKIQDKLYLLRMNNPTIHISWYEANAYTNWKGVRLLKESEWEYLASMVSSDNANLIESTNYNTISVLKDKNINSLGVVGLYGNCWEWCSDTFAPYDGFIKDPINPSMSYPLFGKTKVCRGGSWATSKHIINCYYRKPIFPESCIEYTGFRIAI